MNNNFVEEEENTRNDDNEQLEYKIKECSQLINTLKQISDVLRLRHLDILLSKRKEEKAKKPAPAPIIKKIHMNWNYGKQIESIREFQAAHMERLDKETQDAIRKSWLEPYPQSKMEHAF